MMIPIMPGVVWIAAASLLIILLLVIFGFHAYQRARLKALAKDTGEIGQLAAKKEQLEAEVESLRSSLQTQQTELQKLEAERHNQELVRVDLAQLERKLEERRRESASSLKYSSELDLSVARKRNLLSRLEAEIKTLEERRKSLESLRQELSGIESQIELARIRLATMAEQEIRLTTLRRQVDNLLDEKESLDKELEPMRHEKQRLHQFIVQARQVAAVKNEQLLDQSAHMRQLELEAADMRSQIREITSQKNHLEQQTELLQGELATVKERHKAKLMESEDSLTKARAEAASWESEIAMRKSHMQSLQDQVDLLEGTIVRLELRKENLEAVRNQAERKKHEPRSLLKPKGQKRKLNMSKISKTKQVFIGKVKGR